MKWGSVVILRKDDGAVLMQLRDDKPNILYPNYWVLPSGGRENRETAEQTAKREILEETGYQVDNLRFLFQSLQVIPEGESILRSVFLSRYDGVSKIECLEGQKMEFLYPSGLSELKVFADHVKFIDRMEREIFGGNLERRG